MSERSQTEDTANRNRSTTPRSGTFQEYIGSHWAPREEVTPPLTEAARHAAHRRARLSELYRGVTLVLPAGPSKQRSNDTDYPYRAHSAFAYLTGWGSDTEPGAVLLMLPRDETHRPVIYFRERAGRDSDEFYANPAIGEFWIGPRPSLSQVSSALGVDTRPLAELRAAISAVEGEIAFLDEADPELSSLIVSLRHERGLDARLPVDETLARDISEFRLVKDDYEIEQIRAAIDATAAGFDDIVSSLDQIRGHQRGERVVEGLFASRARVAGNAVGYDTIAAAGPHACILHWTRNDGAVQDGDLVLIDAGVELDSYYTADITRTLPVSGEFTATQRAVYEAVRRAADAAFAIVKPGITFRTIHQTAMESIARSTAEWGFLPVSAEESLLPENQYHRRYMVHGTSHHLGLDVHDCAQARREMYLDGIVAPGMVFTIEPGLYFQPDDLTVPQEFRGIGIRIEDNILVTDDGAVNLSVGIPRTADDVEAWLRRRRD